MIRVHDAVPQLEGALVVAVGLGEGVGVLGGEPGLDRCPQRPRPVVRGIPVIGELGRVGRTGGRRRALGAPGREGGGEPRVEALTLAGEQFAEHDLADELVPEGMGDRRVGDVRVLVVRVDHGHEDPSIDRLPQGVPDLAGRPLHDRREQVVVDEATGRGGRPEHFAGRTGQAGHPGEEDVAEARRQVQGRRIVGGRVAGVRAGRRRGVAAGVQELLDEEWVAVGPLEQRLDQLVVRIATERPLDELGEVAPSERAELDPLDLVHPLQLREVAEERVAVADLVAAHRGHDEDRALADHPGEVGEEVERRPVRPLEVLDDEHERSPAGDPLEGVEHGLEQLGPCPTT